jgi:hypothetical protein
MNWIVNSQAFLDVFSLFDVWPTACSSLAQQGKRRKKGVPQKNKRSNSVLLTAARLTLRALRRPMGRAKWLRAFRSPFRTAAGIQVAGNYSISQEGAATKLVNQQTGRASLLGIGTPQDANSNAAPPTRVRLRERERLRAFFRDDRRG